MLPQYVAPTRWSPERPQTLVVCCSDGRWHAQMMEFVHHEVSEHADLYAVPGGPAVVDPWSSSFDEERAFDAAMRLFVAHHDLSAVWLIAHEGCAYYRLKHPHLAPGALRERQEEDLRHARERILQHHPRFALRLVFASLAHERILFERLPEPGG